MIQSDCLALEAEIAKQVMLMRLKEIDVFVNSFQVLGTDATLMCGLAFSCLYSKPTFIETVTTGSHLNGWRAFGSWQEVLLGVLAAISIGLNIVVMGASAYVLIFGTDLALRGRDDSLARCLNGMHKERRFLLYIYQSGVAATVAVAAALVIAKMRSQLSVLLLCVFLVCLFSSFFFANRTRYVFRFLSTEFV